jgi:hypothetical protein
VLTDFYSRARKFRKFRKNLIVANISHREPGIACSPILMKASSQKLLAASQFILEVSRNKVAANKSWFTVYELTIIKVALLTGADYVSIRGVNLTEGAHMRRGAVFKAVAGKVWVAVTETCAHIRRLDVLYHCVIIVLHHMT